MSGLTGMALTPCGQYLGTGSRREPDFPAAASRDPDLGGGTHRPGEVVVAPESRAAFPAVAQERNRMPEAVAVRAVALRSPSASR
ncbi:MAG: hypothetical protein ACRDQ7_02895 [Haloechinothrix sp.]